MAQKENGRLAAPVEFTFPWLPNGNGAQYSARCEGGIGFSARSRLHRLCLTCWLVDRCHVHAARDLLGDGR